MTKFGSPDTEGLNESSRKTVHHTRQGENGMLIIVRDKQGTHYVNGEKFTPATRLYRKTALTKATRMLEAFSVETLEGTMMGKVGDWLMVGTNGEMYPCDADIFAKTYKLAE